MRLSRKFLRGPIGVAPLIVVVCLAAGLAARAAWAQTPAPAASAPPPFPALPTLLADYRGLHPGSAYQAAGKELRVGHLRLVFGSGTLTAVLTASGREAGFVFEGSGHYAYVSEDAGDLQTLGKNIAKFVNTIAYKDGALDEDMKRCMLVSTTPIPATFWARARRRRPRPRTTPLRASRPTSRTTIRRTSVWSIPPL